MFTSQNGAHLLLAALCAIALIGIIICAILSKAIPEILPIIATGAITGLAGISVQNPPK